MTSAGGDYQAVISDFAIAQNNPMTDCVHVDHFAHGGPAKKLGDCYYFPSFMTSSTLAGSLM